MRVSLLCLLDVNIPDKNTGSDNKRRLRFNSAENHSVMLDCVCEKEREVVVNRPEAAISHSQSDDDQVTTPHLEVCLGATPPLQARK